MTHTSIIPLEVDGVRMYVYAGSGGVAGVDAQTGKLLWETTAWKVKIAAVPSPVPLGDGRILLTGGYDAGSMMMRWFARAMALGLYRSGLTSRMCSVRSNRRRSSTRATFTA